MKGSTAHSQAHFGEGSGEIFLDDVNCEGSEIALLTCPRRLDGHNCRHYEDAGVACLGNHPLTSLYRQRFDRVFMVTFFLFRACEMQRRWAATGRGWYLQWRKSGDLPKQWVGHCVWWSLGGHWCNGCLLSAWLPISGLASADARKS